MGLLKIDRERGEGARRCDDLPSLLRQALAHASYEQQADAHPDRDHRCRRAQDEAEAEGGEGHQQDPGQVRGVRDPGGESVGRKAAAPAGQMDDGDSRDEAGDGEHREWPPDRSRVEAECVRKVHEDEVLDRRDEGEERPGGERGDEPDPSAEDQQLAVLRGP